MKNLDFQCLNKQSKGCKIEKFSWPVGPNHGGASLDTKHVQPPQVKTLCYVPVMSYLFVLFYCSPSWLKFYHNNNISRFHINPLSARILMKIGDVDAFRAQRAPSPSGFSHPDSVQAPLYLW